MYTYGRYWDAKKVMLLYLGDNENTKFREFKKNDYEDSKDVPQEIKHECKLGFVSVLDPQNGLDPNIGKNVLMKCEQ